MKAFSDDKGQSMVEFALLLPILVLILLAIMEGGRLFAGYLELQHAAREGARYASIGKLDSEISNVVKSDLSLLDPASPALTILINPTVRSVGYPVSVSLEYDFEIITPLISDLIGTNVPLRADVVMRVE